MAPDAPAPHEVEITVIGPGVGESVLVHLGLGEWVIVDSCRDYATKEPAALSYLTELGIDPAHQVIAIIATHWDSDHIRGLVGLVESCPKASFFCTGAISSEEFEILLDLAFQIPEALGPRLTEIAQAVAHRRELELGPGAAIRLASESTLILERAPVGILPRRALHALSPSSKSVIETAAKARQALEWPDDLRRRLEKMSRNDASVALLLTIGSDAVLLGADLEQTTDPDRGWRPAVRLASEIGIKASLVKVPHHGSSDAHDDAMWTDTAAERPAAAVTPFRSGSTPLPRITDRERIRGLVEVGILTSDTTHAADPLTLLPLTAGTHGLVQVETLGGFVTWRRRFDDAPGVWRPTLGPNACEV